MRNCRWLGLSLALLIFAAHAHGVITAPLPLEKMKHDSTYVLMTKVTKFDRAQKRLILVLTDILKGKPMFSQVPIIMEGEKNVVKTSGKFTKEEQELKELMQDFENKLLERLEENLPLMLFITHDKNDNFYAKAYTNGTWFSLKGKGNGNEAGVWKLTFAEPYLRKSYTGPTEELRNLIVDREAGKIKKLPNLNEKEPPGYGPKVLQAK